MREHSTITRNREHRNDLVWQSTGRKQYERFDGCRIVYNHNRWLWETFAADGTPRGGYSVLWAAKESFDADVAAARRANGADLVNKAAAAGMFATDPEPF